MFEIQLHCHRTNTKSAFAGEKKYSGCDVFPCPRVAAAYLQVKRKGPFVAQHVPGVLNTAADAISLNNIPLHFPTDTTCDPSTTAAGPVGDQEARLGLQRLDEAVCELFSQGLAESTRAVYRSGWCQYTRFCQEFSLSSP